ncbi:MAG: right-handed parallel beta-helix repeat-containing protein [Anaerolineae bacterium]|nr:right-handed parallel beta-helix repeat-containing protein [Anaerolineae bacterium]
MKRVYLLLMCLLVGAMLSACGPSQEEALPQEGIRVEADGSGDYSTLEEALEEAPEEAIVILGPGTYHLERGLDLSKPLRLVGAGMDRTEIVSEAEGYVLRFSGDGPFAVADITFRHEGGMAADVVVVQGGGVAFARCRFTGAVRAETEEVRAGLRFQGSTAGVMQDCVAEGNDSFGVVVEGQAQPVLEGNLCRENTRSGILYSDSGAGVARQNECTDNGYHGISVNDQAEPTLEENVCADNEQTGIVYFESTGGVARGNECTGNGVGIGVGEHAAPTLEENVCTGNGQAGIGYLGSGGGVARRNECSGNGGYGIYVAETAGPDLADNDCHDNGKEDIQDLRL